MSNGITMKVRVAVIENDIRYIKQMMKVLMAIVLAGTGVNIVW